MKERVKKYFIILSKSGLFFVLFYAGLIYVFKNISDPIANGILEYLKVLIWPLVTVILALVFYGDISSFLHRLIKGKNPFIGEWEASPAAAQAQKQENLEATEVQPAGLEFSQIITEKEAEISALQNNSQQLVELLTKAQIELDFERIYNFIFFNQIELLNQINSFNGEVSFDYVNDHFLKVKQLFSSLNDWNVTQYLAFLVANKIIEYKTSVGNFGSIIITLKGKAFISYITSRNYKKYGL